MTLDIDNPAFKRLAAAILQRHDSGEPEANITSAVRDFLTQTGLAKSDEIVEENPPSDASRRAVDLTALDTFIEVKRRVSGMQSGFNPDPDYVRQIDEYLALSAMEGKGVRTGILTDGKTLAAALARRGRSQHRAALRLHLARRRRAGYPSTNGCATPP